MSNFRYNMVELVGISGNPQVNGRNWQTKCNLPSQLVASHIQLRTPSIREQLPLPRGVTQNDTVTSLPLIHFQFFGLFASRTAPSQYCPCGSFRCLRYNSQLKKPCNAGDVSSTNEPPRNSQKRLAFSKDSTLSL